MKAKRRLMYVITCHHKHVQSGGESTFLVRITRSLEKAKFWMQCIYDDAAANRVSKFGGKYSNPKWLDAKHDKVQVTHNICVAGWINSTTIETYHLTDEWNFNIFSNKDYILE